MGLSPLAVLPRLKVERQGSGSSKGAAPDVGECLNLLLFLPSMDACRLPGGTPGRCPARTIDSFRHAKSFCFRNCFSTIAQLDVVSCDSRAPHRAKRKAAARVLLRHAMRMQLYHGLMLGMGVCYTLTDTGEKGRKKNKSQAHSFAPSRKTRFSRSRQSPHHGSPCLFRKQVTRVVGSSRVSCWAWHCMVDHGHVALVEVDLLLQLTSSLESIHVGGGSPEYIEGRAP